MNLKTLARIILAAIIILIVIGLAEVMSASSTYSSLRFQNDPYHLLYAHLKKVGLAAIALLMGMFIPYEKYKKYSKKALFVVTGLLIFTLAFAPNVKGAGRWIHLGPLSFQPSEIAKIVLIIHVAYLIEAKGKLLQNFKEGFLYPVYWIIGIGGLVFLQPNVSTGLIIFIISFSLMFVGGAKLKHLTAAIGTTAVAAGFVMMLFSHSRARIMTFFNSVKGAGEINIQVTQAKIALGSGGVFGLGWGQSRQSDLFLPEAYGDFIFSILGEEHGFIGATIVLSIYVFIFFVGIVIAKKTKDTYGQLLAFGISFLIILSAFINAAVVTGLFPTTGIPLPFISYGGTSIIFMSLAVGILINIAYKNQKLETIQVNKNEKAAN